MSEVVDENQLSATPETQAPQEEAKKPEVPEPKLFTTSGTPQHPELRTFLEEKLKHPYNKYCIDCKKNLSTHAVVWLGLFVCKTCAEAHRVTFGGNQYSYVKDVFGEMWDDYQLRSICFGGNL